MRPKRFQATRVAQFLVASALVLTALVLPTVNRAAGQLLVGITVVPAAPTIEVNQTKQFTATAHFDDGSQREAVAQTGDWASAGSLATPRYYHSATRLSDGSLLVAGGYNGVNSLATAERWNPGSGVWTSAGTMSRARSAHTATLLPNGKASAGCRPQGSAFRRRRPSSTTSASAAPGFPGQTSAGLPPRSSTRSPAARLLPGSSRRSARSEGSRTPSTATRRTTPTPGRWVSTSERAARTSRPVSSSRSRSSGTWRQGTCGATSSSVPRRTSRGGCCSLWSPRPVA